ncbi:MAG: DUF1285 domain-containing protein [Rhodospirillales bacterium]
MSKNTLNPGADGPSSQRASSLGVPAIADRVPAAGVGRVIYDTLDIRIDRSGVWYYRGSPIRRKELVCLFGSVLHRDEEGGYWLITSTEMGPIEVEDAPFLAVELYACGEGRSQVLSLRSNVDEVVTVDADHPLRVEHDPDTGEPSPYLHLHDGMEARLTPSVFYELVGLGVEEPVDGQRRFGVWSAGRFFVLGSLDADS